MVKVREELEHIEGYVRVGNDRERAITATLDVLTRSDKVYAGVVRAIRRDPAAFGL